MDSLFVETFPVGPLQCNCTILGNLKSGEAVIIDPGDEPQAIAERVQKKNFKVTALLHTHAHFDHIAATGPLKARLSSDPSGASPKIYLHRDDRFLYEALPQQAAMLAAFIPGIPTPPSPLPLDATLDDRDPLDFTSWGGKVLHTPGHTPGSLSFYFPSVNLLFTGDTLFAGSIGRTDLPGGDLRQILSSIKEKLFAIPPETKVIPGHGPKTTLARERATNPFVASI